MLRYGKYAASLLMVLAALVVVGDSSAVASITRVNTDSGGGQTRNEWPGDLVHSEDLNPAVSDDGRYVVFVSNTRDLVKDKKASTFQVYRKDLLTNEVALVSSDRDNQPGYYASFAPSISANGNLVAFASHASLDPSDTNGQTDVYLKNLISGSVQRISTGQEGQQSRWNAYGPAINDRGRYVVFTSQANEYRSGSGNWMKVFRKDTKTGSIEQVSTNALGEIANRDSFSYADISSDGRFVVFRSEATNLAPGADAATSANYNIFRKDMTTGAIDRVNVGNPNVHGGAFSLNRRSISLSGDGNYVVFATPDGNLVKNDTNGRQDIFGKNMATGELSRLSSSSSRGQANSDSSDPVISRDGRVLAFSSGASNLVGSDTNGRNDIFRVDLSTHGVALISSRDAGGRTELGNQGSWRTAIDGDGSHIAFWSDASNLIAGDTNGASDVFRYAVPTYSFAPGSK